MQYRLQDIQQTELLWKHQITPCYETAKTLLLLIIRNTNIKTSQNHKNRTATHAKRKKDKREQNHKTALYEKTNPGPLYTPKVDLWQGKKTQGIIAPPPRKKAKICTIMPWTIPIAIDYCVCNSFWRRSTNWNGPDNWFRRLPMNWNRPDSWFRWSAY